MACKVCGFDSCIEKHLGQLSPLQSNFIRDISVYSKLGSIHVHCVYLLFCRFMWRLGVFTIEIPYLGQKS
jgi:hypothetical protein